LDIVKNVADHCSSCSKYYGIIQ